MGALVDLEDLDDLEVLDDLIVGALVDLEDFEDLMVGALEDFNVGALVDLKLAEVDLGFNRRRPGSSCLLRKMHHVSDHPALHTPSKIPSNLRTRL